MDPMSLKDLVEFMAKSLVDKPDEVEVNEVVGQSANLHVARKIYDLRTEAHLTQAALAKLVRTTRSVISRLEDADYDGHSLSMLRRIAAALNRRVDIRFLPAIKKRRAA